MARIEHVAVKTITAADVTSKAMSAGRAYVHIADMALYGTIAELRAVAVEIDRQLAHLEVEHRIDQAVTKCGTCGCRVVDGECGWCDHNDRATSDEGTGQ